MTDSRHNTSSPQKPTWGRDRPLINRLELRQNTQEIITAQGLCLTSRTRLVTGGEGVPNASLGTIFLLLGGQILGTLLW